MVKMYFERPANGIFLLDYFPITCLVKNIKRIVLIFRLIKSRRETELPPTHPQAFRADQLEIRSAQAGLAIAVNLG